MLPPLGDDVKREAQESYRKTYPDYGETGITEDINTDPVYKGYN
jgi:hypothetical protein